MGAAGGSRSRSRTQAGAKINGWAFTQFDGTVYWDQAGIVRREVSYESLAAWEQDQRACEGKALAQADSGSVEGRQPKTH